TPQTPGFRPPVPTPAFPAPTSPQNGGSRRRLRLYMLVIIPLLVVLLGGGVIGFFLLRNTLTPPPVIGHAFFASSGQLNLNSNEGIADQLRVSVDGLPDPAAG